MPLSYYERVRTHLSARRVVLRRLPPLVRGYKTLARQEEADCGAPGQSGEINEGEFWAPENTVLPPFEFRLQVGTVCLLRVH